MSGTGPAVVDWVLAGSVLLTAGLAVLSPRRVAAVMTFLVLGLLLALVWARLGAPDIALAEAVIAAGVTGALLLDAVSGPERQAGAGHPAGARPRLAVAGTLLGAAVAVALGGAALQAVDGAPADGALGAQASERAAESGVTHPVTAVLLGFRAYDTLLEVAVVVLAVLAVLALHPAGRLSALPAPPPGPVVLRVTVRLLAPLLVLIGGWLLVAGSTRPGGAFQAGALLAGVLLLLRLAGVARAVPTGRWLRPSALVGLLAFLLVAGLTATLGAGWLDLPDAWAGALVLALETVLTGSIGVGLAVLFVAAQDTDSAPAAHLAAGSADRRRR